MLLWLCGQFNATAGPLQAIAISSFPQGSRLVHSDIRRTRALHLYSKSLSSTPDFVVVWAVNVMR